MVKAEKTEVIVVDGKTLLVVAGTEKPEAGKAKAAPKPAPKGDDK